jgi:SAM-dependent methyltransferase
LQLSDGLKVLDFGCGTGYISAAAALLVGQGGSVDAVDLNAGDARRVTCDFCRDVLGRCCWFCASCRGRSPQGCGAFQQHKRHC